MKTDMPDTCGRRKFVATVGKLAGTSLLMTLPGVSSARAFWKPNATLTVQQVIDLILKEIPNPRIQNTVDKIRSGSPDQEVTGIATTMFPTIEVIEKTKKGWRQFHHRTRNPIL